MNISPSRGDTTNDVKKLEGEQVKDSLAKKDQNDGATPEDGDVRSISLSLSLVHFSRLAFSICRVLLVKKKLRLLS